MTTRKNLKNGEPNPNYVDLLDEDPKIAGQKFCCVSFVSPESVLKRREHFFFSEFVKTWEFEKASKRMMDFLNFVSFKHKIQIDKLMKDFEDYMTNEQERLREDAKAVKDDFEGFLEKNEPRLQKEFDKQNQFRTSTRGIKIRGSYGNIEEAQLRAKLLRERDPNHDIYVGEVGVWMPWEPDAYKTGKVDYLEEELNQLVTEKKKNEERAKQEFEERVKESKRKAIEENVRKAKETGNKLTQMTNEEGELVGVNGTNTVETAIKENVLAESREVVTGADIRNELFNSDDARTKQKDSEYRKDIEERFAHLENKVEESSTTEATPDVSGSTSA